jgi:hypothetical protein
MPKPNKFLDFYTSHWMNGKNKLHKDLVLFCYFMQILQLAENNSSNRWASITLAIGSKNLSSQYQMSWNKHHNENRAMLISNKICFIFVLKKHNFRSYTIHHNFGWQFIDNFKSMQWHHAVQLHKYIRKARVSDVLCLNYWPDPIYFQQDKFLTKW